MLTDRYLAGIPEGSRASRPGSMSPDEPVGASSIEQLERHLGALQQPDFTAVELEEIDRYATDSGINIWAASSEN